jgi:hypothetical protein
MVALTRKGGFEAAPGTYWNIDNGELVRLERRAALPGEASTKFLKLPVLLLLLLSPVLGLAFVLFLPLVGLTLVVYLPLKALTGKLAAAARRERDSALELPGGATEPADQ